MDQPTGLGICAIVLGAVPGAWSRYYLTLFCQRTFGPNFPYGTLIVNVSGCFFMGFFFSLFQGSLGIAPELDLLVRTGFLGAYTTFSTYGYETFSLWQRGQRNASILYGFGSASLGIIAMILGRELAQIWQG